MAPDWEQRSKSQPRRILQANDYRDPKREELPPDII
jgi:hypothetical protein